MSDHEPETRGPTYPARLRTYTTLVVGAAAPIITTAIFVISKTPIDAGTLIGAGVFGLASTIAEAKPVPLDETGHRTVSLAFIFLLACQVLFGWEYAVLAAVLAMAVSQAIERVELRRALFNTGVYALSAFVSAIPGALLDWDGTATPPGASLRLTILAFAGGALFVLTNVLMIAIAVAFAQGASIRSMLDDYVRHAGLAFLIMVFISALAMSLWKISATLELLLAGPLFALALYQRYAYRTVLATRDAETDGLTGLRNHRAFHSDFEEVLAAATVDGPVALVSLDIDDFKSVNDQLGHQAGDSVLRGLAAHLTICFGTERTYRVGGEEFAVLLPGLGAIAARAAIDEARDRLADAPAEAGTALRFSAGVAEAPAMGTDRSDLMQMADSALYWAKNHGKHRTAVYATDMARLQTREEVAADAERHARLRAAESLIRVVDAKDTYTGAHSQSVSALAEGIARTLGLPDETVEQMRLAGLLHDLGKIAIPDRILQKAGQLTPEEYATLKDHAEIGCRILEGSGVAPIDTWVRHHHEHWDGSGYPLGLVGDEIPLGSRVILVADAFDAMTTDRVYRARGTVDQALAELRRTSWTQFDARVVAALTEYVGQLDNSRAEAG